MQFITISSYVPTADYVSEKFTGKTMTVQGESYTIAELFQRHMAGQLPQLNDQSFYQDTDDFDMIDFNALRSADPFDRMEMIREISEKAKTAMDKLEQWKKMEFDRKQDELRNSLDNDESDDTQEEPKKPKGKAKSDAKQSDKAKTGADKGDD